MDNLIISLWVHELIISLRMEDAMVLEVSYEMEDAIDNFMQRCCV